ncbi:MAG: prolipoprotein diacylglyceryl transferase, partial [Oscillospiraceae bacterium]|nr:prolipoprotein diacylglyceryl transferase [Oscillospiraceae bacterium]
MEQVLSFPKLGLDLTLNRIAFSIFGIDIYWYGLIMATGFALAVIYCLHRTKDYGLANDDVLDITIFSTIGAIICARAYYVIFQWEEFAGDLTRIFDIRQGGIAVYGSLIGA